MNGYQRIFAAQRGEWPDQIPIILHNFMPAAHEAGITMATFRSEPEEAARAFIEFTEKYQCDGIIVDIDTTLLAGAAGVPVDYPEDAPARCHQGRLSWLEEVSDLAPVDLAVVPAIQVSLEIVSRLRRYFGDEILIRGNCDQCPFSLASLLRTPAEWMMDLMDPDKETLVRHLLDYCTELTCQFLRLMAASGAHMLSNGDSPAGPDMVSPTVYRRFALPYEQRVSAQAHELGLPYWLHICGNTNLILEDMLKSGADGFELDYKTDPMLARNKFKNEMVFIGNVDPSGVIAAGSPELVITKTLELLRVFDTTPRFVLNAGCAIPPTAPKANLLALIQTARQYHRALAT
jgi:uroporphyrinogen decarboxylase